ncbi:MAG: PEPxxWA-CTERM sorting domain-containing protein [Caenispirillum sp.]|nr:PEPxxWA-CTERM sorting domain-containing protein [Caenispirillum sp.]
MQKIVCSLLALIWSAAVQAQALPPMNPAAYSQVSGSTNGSTNITLWDTGELFNSYTHYDNAYQTTTALGTTTSFNRGFTQYDGSSVSIEARAQSAFGINKVYVSRSGAVPAPLYNEYGTMPANQNGWNLMIERTEWWSGAYSTAWDPYNNRFIWHPSTFTYQDDGSSLVFGQDDGSGNFVPTTTHGVRQHSSAGWVNDGYLLPNDMPVVSVDRNFSASANAYSRWENIFYFAPRWSTTRTSGTATLTVHIDGSYDTTSGGYQFMARDWEHKDLYGTYLGFANGWLNGSGTIDHMITLAVPFTYGTPQYVKAELSAWLGGSGFIDLFNTARIVSIEVPEDTAVFSYGDFLAGTGPGFTVLGGVSGASLPGGAGGYFAGLGGGGGGYTPPVPEPGTWAMLLAGLGLLGFAARRRV